jgi:hypothetical protein
MYNGVRYPLVGKTRCSRFGETGLSEVYSFSRDESHQSGARFVRRQF